MLQFTESASRRAIHASSTYHKFVKTTPKPNATKKSNGELVGPPPPPPPVGVPEGAAGAGEATEVGIPVVILEEDIATQRQSMQQR